MSTLSKPTSTNVTPEYIGCADDPRTYARPRAVGADQHVDGLRAGVGKGQLNTAAGQRHGLLQRVSPADGVARE